MYMVHTRLHVELDHVQGGARSGAGSLVVGVLDMVCVYIESTQLF